MYRSSELSEIQLKELSNNEIISSESNVNKLTKFNTFKKSKENKCKFCGYSHEFKRDHCPAFGKKCSKCDKMNHFASICKSFNNEIKLINEATEENDGAQIENILSINGDNILIADLFFVKTTSSNKCMKVHCQLDTGATCNVIGKTQYLQR